MGTITTIQVEPTASIHMTDTVGTIDMVDTVDTADTVMTFTTADPMVTDIRVGIHTIDDSHIDLVTINCLSTTKSNNSLIKSFDTYINMEDFYRHKQTIFKKISTQNKTACIIP